MFQFTNLCQVSVIYDYVSVTLFHCEVGRNVVSVETRFVDFVELVPCGRVGEPGSLRPAWQPTSTE